MGFVIVEFTKEHTMETIPKEWITPSKKNAFWPLTKDYEKKKKYLQGEFDLKLGKWDKVPIRMLGFADSYGVAKDMEVELQYTSNPDKTPVITGKRKRRRNPKFDSSSDDDDDESLKMSFKKSSLPNFPKCSSPQSGDLSSSLILNTTECMNLLNEKCDAPIELCRIPENHVQSDLPVSSNNVQCSQNITLLENESPVINLLKKIISQNAAQAFEISLLKKQLAEVKNLIHDISPPAGLCINTELYELPLPIKSTEDLNLVEKFLSNPSKFSDMVTHLKKLGGTNLKECVYRQMHKVFGSVLARSYSLHGKKGKVPFKFLNLYKAITFSVQSVMEAEENDINKMISLFLAGAIDRDGGRKERATKKIMECTNFENSTSLEVFFHINPPGYRRN